MGGDGSQGGSPFDGFDFSSFSSGGFSSFFQNLFGGMGAAASAAPVDNGERHSTLSIDLYTALLGGTVELQLPSGQRVRLNVKPSTQPGTKVRLRGKGAVGSQGTLDDLIVTYQVQLPTHLSDRQRDLLQQMRQG